MPLRIAIRRLEHQHQHPVCSRRHLKRRQCKLLLRLRQQPLLPHPHLRLLQKSKVS
jgi:hypothetical protein